MNAVFRFLTAGLALVVWFATPIAAQKRTQETFATPELAASAVLSALQSKDEARILSIFGPEAREAFSSGDPTLDRIEREVMTAAMSQSWRWVARGSRSRELVVGDEGWPFPVPLVRRGTTWTFDTAAGKQEVLARRVGRNELKVIGLCRQYVFVQQRYASEGHDGNPAEAFAQQFRSDAGKQNGLYWETGPGESPSPMGDLAAKAAVEGYDRRASGEAAPFHGYHFRILTAQGRNASGGPKNYVVDGRMTQGFALIAYPAKYRNSGVMTFVVNQDGVVYEKDLGPDTERLATANVAFNPDRTWRRVQ